jgi:predicted aldo/keto reductase-like oxidoreductase
MRRNFLKSLAWGTLSALSVLPRSVLQSRAQDRPQGPGRMAYRRLGKTDLLVSEISLGGSPMPDWSLLRQIIDRGVNYIDSSSTYENGNAERKIGRLFKEIGRDKVFVATKFHLRGGWSEESILNSVEGSLRRLQTDWVDILCIHGAEREHDLVDERVLGAFSRLKKQGKFRFSGLSCHSNHKKVVKKAVDCGYYDMVQMGYNVFDIEEPEREIETYKDYLGTSGLRDLIRYATARDIGVIAMKTLKVGGRRQDLAGFRTADTSLYQAMLKWVLENKNIASVVTEMLNREQMEEDLAVAGTPLSAKERRALFSHVAENSRDYCHMCGRCQDQCPCRIPTTEILRLLAYHESYGKTAAAKEGYGELRPEETALACQSCGQCERACPYVVRVRTRIRYAHSVLSG